MSEIIDKVIIITGAVASPKPLLAPVMMTTLFWISDIEFFLVLLVCNWSTGYQKSY